MKNLFGLILVCCFTYSYAQTYAISGELKQWHKVTLTFNGPTSSEGATPNPFADYRFTVTFTNGSKTYVVPGYFAGDGNAAESSSTSGNKWRVHFAPDATGVWNFSTTFYTGTDAAINSSTTTTGVLHGLSGAFTIAASDKTGRDHRGRGRLAYVGEHYLRFLGDSTWFFKGGADAPENTLAYEDFDDVPNRGGRRKSWQPHQQDYNAADASSYTWQNGKGTELLGVINYLANKGANVFSFLTFSLAGDDENVFPHLLKVPISTYNTYADANQWDLGVHHDRFDISRLDQWERLYEYADKRGLYIHFKTQETENDQKMDGGNTGRERKLYYRELIARFSHHLALNWNTGEENSQTAQQEIDMAAYINAVDPYKHLIVMHTYPGETNRYTPLLGTLSQYRGASIQTSNGTFNELYDRIAEWVGKSKAAGKKWVVSCDEPGNASIGVNSDPNDIKLVRQKVLWATLFAGGGGVEYYYGYQSGCGDLDCQDHRTRDVKYAEASHAIKFVQNYLQSNLITLQANNAMTSNTDDYVTSNGSNFVVVYVPNGGVTNITLPSSTQTWYLDWYNPRTGAFTDANTIVSNSFTAPDNLDWVAILSTSCPNVGTSCNDGNPNTTGDVINTNCLCVGTPIPCPAAGTACNDNNPMSINDVEDGNCNCFGTFPSGKVHLFEAEEAQLGASWSLVADPNACEKFYMLPPNISVLSAAPEDSSSRLRFTFNITQAGTYSIFARTITSNGGDDSFWVRIDGGIWLNWNRINYPYTNLNFQWSQVGNWVSGNYAVPQSFSFAVGTHTVDFAYREPNAKLDKIFITQDDLSVLNIVQNNTTAGDYSLNHWLEESCPNDTILFVAATNGININLQAQHSIDKPLYIFGNGSASTLISGGNSQQLFTNATSNNLHLKDLSFINGFAISQGGAFKNLGTITLERITFKGNYESTTLKAFTNLGNIIVKSSPNVINK